jgi:hypothetical protein
VGHRRDTNRRRVIDPLPRGHLHQTQTSSFIVLRYIDLLHGGKSQSTVRPRRRDGASIAVAFRGCRLFVGAVIRLDRALLMLFCIRAKYLVRKLFLLIRHSRVKRLESGNQILHMLSVRLSDLLV